MFRCGSGGNEHISGHRVRVGQVRLASGDDHERQDGSRTAGVGGSDAHGRGAESVHGAGQHIPIDGSAHNFGFMETTDFKNFHDLGHFGEGTMKREGFAEQKHGAVTQITEEEAAKLERFWK